MAAWGVTGQLIYVGLCVCIGSMVRLGQLKLEAENRPLNFSSPEADLRQFVLPATVEVATKQSVRRSAYAKPVKRSFAKLICLLHPHL